MSPHKNIENLDTINNKTIILIIFGALICIFCGGRDSGFWGLKKKQKSVDEKKSGKEILYEVGKGTLSPKGILLTEKQLSEMTSLIIQNPENYNSTQKSLIYSTKDGEEILNEVKDGKIDLNKMYLTSVQINQIKKKIEENPSLYNDIQQSLIREKTGEEILNEVGMGKADPSDINITKLQYEEIIQLIKNNPNDYNDLQKSLLIKK